MTRQPAVPPALTLDPREDLGRKKKRKHKRHVLEAPALGPSEEALIVPQAKLGSEVSTAAQEATQPLVQVELAKIHRKRKRSRHNLEPSEERPVIGTSTEVSHSQGDDDVREAVQLPSNFYPGEDSCRKSKKRAKKSKALIATLHAGSAEGLSAAQPAAQTPEHVDEAQDVQAPCVESPSRPSRLDLQHELECTESHSPRPAAGETAAKINEMDRQQAVPNRTVQEAKEAKRLAREAREARKASKKARLRATIARLEQQGNSSPCTLRAPAVDTARKESLVSAKTCRRSGDVATPDNAQPQDATLQGDSVRPGDNATPD